MSDFEMVAGFEDVWRPPVQPRRVRQPETVLSPTFNSEARARLQRIVARAPEVMVKVTGRTRDSTHLRAHLDYITRNGELDAEDQTGAQLVSRRDIRDLAGDWSEAAMADPRRRENSPVSHSIILSMPAGTDTLRLWDASRAFADQTFGARFEYVFVLHTDTPRPHVHLSVRSLGIDGERLNPKKGDLEAWRQQFAEALRERGVAAEATPRRARGISRKAERIAVRKIQDRHTNGRPIAQVRRRALHEAAAAAFRSDTTLRPWEKRLSQRQGQVRRLYLAQAKLLLSSPNPADVVLGRALAAYVSDMPPPDSQRLLLARQLRQANAPLVPDRTLDRDRSR